uniref:Uncharacterized protein n=1 Tax=Branchiostoma floridae TaxID=7739 RepID=C3XZ06_BRAFL|eukprot:XP_002610560.1 hypothetical protein BRAFLDRAFT_65725 [Branchiostoma floridae]
MLWETFLATSLPSGVVQIAPNIENTSENCGKKRSVGPEEPGSEFRISISTPRSKGTKSVDKAPPLKFSSTESEEYEWDDIDICMRSSGELLEKMMKGQDVLNNTTEWEARCHSIWCFLLLIAKKQAINYLSMHT